MATECTHATPVTCYAAGHFPPDPGEIARKRAAYLEAQANAGRGDVCACEDPNRADIPGNPAAVCGTCGGLLPGCEGCGAEAGEECRPDCTGRAQVTCDRCGARTEYGNDLCNACIDSQHALGTPGEQVGDVFPVDIPEETVRALLGPDVHEHRPINRTPYAHAHATLPGVPHEHYGATLEPEIGAGGGDGIE